MVIRKLSSSQYKNIPRKCSSHGHYMEEWCYTQQMVRCGKSTTEYRGSLIHLDRTPAASNSRYPNNLSRLFLNVRSPFGCRDHRDH